jgi:uncharacterized membrane protein YkgB
MAGLILGASRHGTRTCIIIVALLILLGLPLAAAAGYGSICAIDRTLHPMSVLIVAGSTAIGLSYAFIVFMVAFYVAYCSRYCSRDTARVPLMTTSESELF